MLVFDAEQLSFKKLPKEEITWVTIRGNHVPIPKGGSREEKARAIKEWFANKKKDLPQGKGRVSFYSARVEHERPKRTAKGSGEGAEVHGAGQYTLKLAENNLENYFNKFGNIQHQDWSDVDYDTAKSLKMLGNMRGIPIEKIKDKVDKYIEETTKKIESHKENLKTYQEMSGYSKEQMEEFLKDSDKVFKITGRGGFADINDAWRWANVSSSETKQGIQHLTEGIEETKNEYAKFKELVDAGKIKATHSTYKVGDKVYREEFSNKVRQKDVYFSRIKELHKLSVPERKEFIDKKVTEINNSIAEYEKAITELDPKKDWNANWYKREYESTIRSLKRDKSWWEKVDYENITAAKAQMSMVRLPASKTYLREATGLRRQSPYVKNAVKSALVESYGVGRLRDLGLSDLADEFESIIDDALAINNAHSTPQHIEHMLEDMKLKLHTGFEENRMHGVPFGRDPEAFKQIAPPVLRNEKAEKLNEAMYLVNEISDNLKYTLLAKNNIDDLMINNGRGLYTRIGKNLANAKTKSYWGASTGQVYNASSKILAKHGISGVAYTGHGVSRISGFTDGEGNVTFDPDKITVLERTTDPDVIRGWIEKQKKIYGKGKKNA